MHTKKDLCEDEIEVCAQNMLITVPSIVNTIGRACICDHLARERILTLTSYACIHLTET